VKDTAEEFVVIASHWPSRRHGRLESEPLRIAVAENIAFLVRDHVRVDSIKYEQLRAQNNLTPVKDKWETPILLFGDFNDEPFDIAVVDHLQASSELDRVVGPTNEIKSFEKELLRARPPDSSVSEVPRARPRRLLVVEEGHDWQVVRGALHRLAVERARPKRSSGDGERAMRQLTTAAETRSSTTPLGGSSNPRTWAP
jgi:hypothetical protein